MSETAENKPPARWVRILDGWRARKRALAAFGKLRSRLLRHTCRRGSPLRRWLQIWAFQKPELVAAHLTWVFTAMLAFFAVVAWTEARRSTQVLQDQLDEIRDEQRAWIYPISARPRLIARVGDAVAVLTFLKFKNIGKRPAHMTTISRAYYTHFSSISKGGACDSAFVAGGETIFPDQEKEIFDPASIEQKDWVYGVSSVFYIVGCAVYTYPTSKRVHRTSYAYEIKLENGNAFYEDKPFPDIADFQQGAKVKIVDAPVSQFAD